MEIPKTDQSKQTKKWSVSSIITDNNKMKWYHYIACFFAGFFLTNVVPHFIHGVSGDSFPTPFADPPGKGLSSPMINTLWALFNLVIGYLLFRVGKVSGNNKWALLIFFIGIVSCSIVLSISFVDKMHQ